MRLTYLLSIVFTLLTAACKKDEELVTAKPLDTVRPAPQDERPIRDSVNLVKSN